MYILYWPYIPADIPGIGHSLVGYLLYLGMVLLSQVMDHSCVSNWSRPGIKFRVRHRIKPQLPLAGIGCFRKMDLQQKHLQNHQVFLELLVFWWVPKRIPKPWSKGGFKFWALKIWVTSSKNWKVGGFPSMDIHGILYYLTKADEQDFLIQTWGFSLWIFRSASTCSELQAPARWWR